MFLAGVIPGLVAGLMLMVAIYIMARFKNLPSEEWKGFGEILAGGKEAGWGLFLIIIIIGGIYGGVFTPTEAAAVAAVYSFVIALFVYRDMGPMKGETWLKDTDPRRARVGFSSLVYAMSFFFVWMILSFFIASEWEGVTAGGRALVGLALSFAIMVAYAMWRDPGSNPLNIPGYLVASLPVWGRNLSLMGRNFFRAFFHDDTRKVMVDSSKTIIMLMFIIVNALLFAHVLTSERIPQAITDWMIGAGFNWFTFLIAVNLLLLLGGQFMEPSGLLLIVAPVVFPDRHGAGRRSDPPRHHHGGEHGDRHDHPADRAQPVRHLGHYRHDPAAGGASRTAVRRRAVPVPDPGDLCAGAVDVAALHADGAGDRHQITGPGPPGQAVVLMMAPPMVREWPRNSAIRWPCAPVMVTS